VRALVRRSDARPVSTRATEPRRCAGEPSVPTRSASPIERSTAGEHVVEIDVEVGERAHEQQVALDVLASLAQAPRDRGRQVGERAVDAATLPWSRTRRAARAGPIPGAPVSPSDASPRSAARSM
jgi:hypothetical protein